MDNLTLEQFEKDIENKTIEMNAVREKLKKENEVVLKELFKRFFEMFPKVPGVTWTQYTPGFNDGDPCEFSLGDILLLIEKGSDADIDDCYEEEVEINEKLYYADGYNIKDEKLEKAFDALANFINSSSDTLESMYGGDQRIIFLADGTVQKQDYDCGY